jgi:uncharacterized membrane protein
MLMRPPNGDHAARPVSSYNTINTFGAPSGAFFSSYGVQSGFESRTSSLITPLNASVIAPPRLSGGPSVSCFSRLGGARRMGTSSNGLHWPLGPSAIKDQSPMADDRDATDRTPTRHLSAATQPPELARPVSVTAVTTLATAAETLASGAEVVRLALDAVGIGVITIGAAAALGGVVRARFRGERVRFDAIRLMLARYLALALEFQLAADVVDTAVSPEWRHIGQLAAIATIAQRSITSWAGNARRARVSLRANTVDATSERMSGGG